jgi:transposase
MGIILGMDFPIVDLFDDDLSAAWLLQYFHSNDLRCPLCGRSVEEARLFRVTRRRRLTVYRCPCQGIATLYSGTVFEGKHLRPAQAILSLRGVCKGEPTATMAREIGVTRQTVHSWRQAIQAKAVRLQPQDPLPDQQTETDEMVQNAGEKGESHPDPADPPRRRANHRRGHGTYENDRPPIVGTVGRQSGQVRLRVVHHTDEEPLVRHVHAFTLADAVVFTDEWQSYDHIMRVHATVCHGAKEWVRDDDGDGLREVHVNTSEGMWTTVRNFLISLIPVTEGDVVR